MRRPGRISVGLSACCAVYFLMGCKDNAPIDVDIREVLRGDQCGLQQAGASLLDRAGQWQALTGGARFIDEAVPADRNFEQLSRHADLVLLALGARPSPGYGIRIKGEGARLEDDGLLIPLDVLTPAADSLQATVMTSPCVVLAVGRDARVAQLRFEGAGFNYTVELPQPRR